MDISGLSSVNTPSELKAWLEQHCLTPIKPVMTGSDLGAILEKIIEILGDPDDNLRRAIIAAPVHPNEASAAGAGLAPFTFYKTATGELRYKLPGNNNNNAFTYTLPFTLS